MEKAEYIQQTFKALTHKNTGSFHFQYQIQPSGTDTLCLAWKKHVATENIKVHMVQCKPAFKTVLEIGSPQNLD